MAAAGCSGGGDGTAGESSDPASTVVVDDTSADGAAPTTSVEPSSNREAVVEPVFTDVVDAGATDRCDALGYACGWADVAPATMERSFEILDDLEAEVEGLEPIETVEQVTLALRRHSDVSEILPDLESYTGVAFRVGDSPLIMFETAFAGPLDLGEVASVGVPDLPDDVAATTIAGFAGRGFATPERYHPVGGPLNPRTAVVIEPYATEDEQCADIEWAGFGRLLDLDVPVDVNECRRHEGVTEGSAVAAIFRSKPDHYADVVHLTDSQANPTAISSALASADLVHIVTHGSSNCVNARPTEELSPSLQPDDYDSFVCYSMLALGPLSAQDRADMLAGNLVAPPGTSFSGTRWWTTGDFFAKSVKSDAIVFANHCTSGDGQLASAGLAGFLGWHKYARIGGAVDAAMRFWSLMVIEGVEFDVAYEQLRDEGLHRSAPTNPDEHFGVVPTAQLVAGGTNPRARDVVTAEVDGADIDGAQIDVRGLPDDGTPETFPTDEQSLTFELEGVATGSAGSVQFSVLLDDTELDADIELERDGTVIRPGEAWDTWRVTVRPDAIRVPTTAADYGPGVTKKLEIRAYERTSQYTADVGDVRLNAKLVASGPLPIFQQLADGMPAQGYIEGNDLRFEFETAGGPVTGTMEVVMGHEVAGQVGHWRLDLAGTYDPATGAIGGDGFGLAAADLPGFEGIGDAGSGTWSGTVDLSGGTMVAQLGIGDGSQSYVGTLEAAG